MGRNVLAILCAWLILCAPPALAADHGNGQPVVTGQVTGNSLSGTTTPGGGQWQVPMVIGNALNVTQANAPQNVPCFGSVAQNSIRGYTRAMSPIIDGSACVYTDLLVHYGANRWDSVSTAVLGITAYRCINSTSDTLSLFPVVPVHPQTGFSVGDTIGTFISTAGKVWTDTTLDFQHGEIAVPIYLNLGMTDNGHDGTNSQGLGSSIDVNLFQHFGFPFADGKWVFRVRLLALYLNGAYMGSGRWPYINYQLFLAGGR